MLNRLIYYSENHLGASDGKMIRDLNTIMETSNRNNAKVGITGALVFDTVWFLQILEGERAAIGATLRRIMADERHDDIVVMECVPISERAFGNWWMGLALLRGDQSVLYRKHGLGQRLDPRTMSGEQVLELARDLASAGLERKLTYAAA